jgi:glycogen synthase
LERYIQPFGTSNGGEVKDKRSKVKLIDKAKSKEYLQSTYLSKVDPNACIFSFLGRITE